MFHNSMRAKWNTANARLANKPFENLFNDESRVCVRCGRPYIEANKKYTRLYGVMCICGSQEWKDAEQSVQSDVCHECGETETIDPYNDGVPVCVFCGTRR